MNVTATFEKKVGGWRTKYRVNVSVATIIATALGIATFREMALWYRPTPAIENVVPRIMYVAYPADMGWTHEASAWARRPIQTATHEGVEAAPDVTERPPFKYFQALLAAQKQPPDN